MTKFLILLVCQLIISGNILNYARDIPITLKIAPFPYLPDSVDDQYQSLFEFIKREFENIHPNINLELRPLNISDGFYNMETLSQWLSSNGNGYDIVEIDSVLLGDVVTAGLASPQLITFDTLSDWHSAAISAVQFNQAMYAYPHLMCATFLFTRNNQASQARTIDQLINALGHTPTNNYRLVGNLDSSWALPGRLLSSHQASSNSQSNVAALALHAYENVSFESVRKLARLCDLVGGENHCLDGTFDSNPDMPAILFAHKQAQALFGYSEQLFLILKNGSPDDYNDIQMISLPSGTNHNQPLFSTDAYVFRRNMSNEILNAARSFVEFMATPHMQAAIVASGDSPYPNTIPRYLLPISNNAYRDPLLVDNRFYQHYFCNLTGFSMPNIGFLNTRKQLQAALLKYIK